MQAPLILRFCCSGVRLLLHLLSFLRADPQKTHGTHQPRGLVCTMVCPAIYLILFVTTHRVFSGVQQHVSGTLREMFQGTLATCFRDFSQHISEVSAACFRGFQQVVFKSYRNEFLAVSLRVIRNALLLIVKVFGYPQQSFGEGFRG